MNKKSPAHRPSDDNNNNNIRGTETEETTLVSVASATRFSFHHSNNNNNRICILSERLIIGKIGMIEDDELGLSSKTVVGMDVCLPQQHSH